ncbi:MAG: hydroxymethylbilane synthase [Syntrophorhabdaceae bacterium]|nr:hydroxymethylbilane synthase [Syntrophorhabdaceae bacterium]
MGGSLIRLGSRASMLALWQAEYVKRELERTASLRVEIVKIRTTGDAILDTPLARVGGKGLFVKEIEEALLSGRVDLAVHSMKDVPVGLPDGLGIVCVTKREDPRDAFLSVRYERFEELPQGARVGTSSLRRQTQLLAARPDLGVVSLRGNIDSRIRKMEEGAYDAVILAAAGVRRLGWEGKIRQYLSVEQSIPAIGQGALGIEARLDDELATKAVAFLNDAETRLAVCAERKMLERLDGGCQAPIAGYAKVLANEILLTGMVGRPDGSEIARGSRSGPLDAPEELGIALAEELLMKGGRRILEEVYIQAKEGKE